jgi:glycosyltransferase involved in cell wall biosynthesis
VGLKCAKYWLTPVQISPDLDLPNPVMRGAMTSASGQYSTWPEVSVVIPTLNEARNLPYVFAGLPLDIHEVIVVDGHSVDGTLQVVRQLRPDVRIVTQTREGKGNALACGFTAATGDIIAMIDADGSADPSEIPKFIKALVDGADFAKGSRFLPGGGSSDITRLRSLGNRALTSLINVLYGTRYTDLCYGLNAFWRKHLPILGLDATTLLPAGVSGDPLPAGVSGDGRLWGDGFEVETLIHTRVAQARLVVAEVPSFEYSRIHGVSNLNAFSDGLRVLYTILRECPPAHRMALTSAAQAMTWRPRHGAGGGVVDGHERLPRNRPWQNRT